MFKTALACAVLVVLATTGAKADHPFFSWTGAYVGAHVGGAWSHNDWFVPFTPLNVTGGCGGCPRPGGEQSGASLLAGGQIGLNFQTGRWVFGIEADASWANLLATEKGQLALINNTKAENVGTIAARVGMSWDRWMVYVKGGGAGVHTTFFTSSAFFPVVQTTTSTRWGWVVGAGLEYAWQDNWSFKLEYNRLEFGRDRETVACVSVAACFQGFDYDIKQTIQLVKFGVNYRFSGLFAR